MTDQIADMFTRIRNAAKAKYEQVVVPYSRTKESVAKILRDEGFLVDVVSMGSKTKKSLVITIKYLPNKKPVFSELKKVSTIGRRVYLGKDEVKPVRYGRGLAIISTSKGMLKDEDARKKGIGGELICTIW